MIDIQFVRDHPEVVKEKSKQKGYEVDVDALLELDTSRKEILTQVENLRAKRNEIASSMKGGRPDEATVSKGKQIKSELTDLEEKLTALAPYYALTTDPKAFKTEVKAQVREVEGMFDTQKVLEYYSR